jgi:MFS family permease
MIFSYAQQGALCQWHMIRELGLSPAIMGLLLSSGVLVYADARWLVDRTVRKSYAIGYAFWSVMSVHRPGYGVVSLIVARVLLGAGQSVAFPASARAVANWFPDRERGTVTGAYLMGVRLGQALIVYLAGRLLVTWGWKFFFVMTGVVPLLWLIPWNAFLKKWEHRGIPVATAVTAKAASPSFAKSFTSFEIAPSSGSSWDSLPTTIYCPLTWLPGYLVLGRGSSQGDGFLQLCSLCRHVGDDHAGGIGQRLDDSAGWRETVVRKAIVAGMAIACLIVPAGMVEDK